MSEKFTPWPQKPGKRGLYYPGTDAELYNVPEAVALMRRLATRGLTSRAFSSVDDFDLAEHEAIMRFGHEAESK